jgi:hypothetical protein
MVALGATLLAARAEAIMKTFMDEPGSKRSATARLRRVSGSAAP